MLSQQEKLNLIQQIEQKLGLQFLKETNSRNLCFVNNNDELQNEFKQSFTEQDFYHFLNYFENQAINIPDDALTFWQLVKKGKQKLLNT